MKIASLRNAALGLTLASNLCFATSIYFIGNSVTDCVSYDRFNTMAESRANHTVEWGRQMIPGAPLQWLWANPADGYTEPPYGYPTNAFANYTWDAVSLQTFISPGWNDPNSDSVTATKYINILKGRSPNAQVYVYERWITNSRSSVSPTGPHWDSLWHTQYPRDPGSDEAQSYFWKLTAALRKAYPAMKPACMFPIGEVFHELNHRMMNGEIPGYSSIWDVYSDEVHQTDKGQFIAGTTVFATLFKENPRGLSGSFYSVTDQAFVTAVQTAVWKVVNNHPYSGVGTTVVVDNAAMRGTLSVSPSHPGRTDRRVALLTLSGRTVPGAGLQAPIPLFCVKSSGHRTALSTVNSR